jgi:hypothetical protein
MTSSHRAAHDALFFAFLAGAGCYFVSFVGLVAVGFVTGFEHWEISFTTVPQKHLSWWEIVSLLVSLVPSVFTALLFGLRLWCGAEQVKAKWQKLGAFAVG